MAPSENWECYTNMKCNFSQKLYLIIKWDQSRSGKCGSTEKVGFRTNVRLVSCLYSCYYTILCTSSLFSHATLSLEKCTNIVHCNLATENISNNIATEQIKATRLSFYMLPQLLSWIKIWERCSLHSFAQTFVKLSTLQCHLSYKMDDTVEHWISCRNFGLKSTFTGSS